jgi:uncharacterized protein (UPF0261 family)
MPVVALFATLDTKGAEAAFTRECLTALGVGVVVVDCGAGEPLTAADIPAAETAAAGGAVLAELRARGDRGETVAAMARGAAAVAAGLHAAGRIQGVLGLGGSAGTTIATAAMRALPLGVPKVMVSTMASGDTRPYVGTADIAMLYSVVDVAGVNRISRRILGNAAAAVAGMVGAPPPPPPPDDRPLIAASMFGVTTPCVTRARQVLETAGYEVLVFHATGSGGRALEELARGGFLAGVLDLTTTELADELVGGVLSAGPNRLEAAGAAGIPQVVAPGALDMVNFGPPETVPERFGGRLFYRHNPTVTLMRTTAGENAELGRITARKLAAARGPVAVLLPRLGVSALDREGQPFWDPVADAAYRAALREGLPPTVTLRELDLHINDPEFAEAAAAALLALSPTPSP